MQRRMGARVLGALALVLLQQLLLALSGAGSAPQLARSRWAEPAGVAQSEAGAARGAARPGAANCSWQWVEQPLDHFSGMGGAAAGRTFRERVCVIDAFRQQRRGDGAAASDAPMLLYVGNEAPVELYINNSGLMYDLAAQTGAVVVFLEHRYFGQSVPQLEGLRSCMSFLTSAQALADYALAVPQVKRSLGLSAASKVVAFGGSYGGMLAAWFRQRYPHVCTGGALAASAPVWGFASSRPPLDGSYAAISQGAETADGRPHPQCRDSYLAAWVALDLLLNRAGAKGRALASSMLRTCRAVREGEGAAVLRTLQDVLFLLAESNFPFPSDYIVYATVGYNVPLPAWPMRRTCELITQPAEALRLEGDRANVRFSVQLDGETIDVNWDQSSVRGGADALERLLVGGATLRRLAEGARDVYAMLYNITGDSKCLQLDLPADPTPGRETNSSAPALAPTFPRAPAPADAPADDGLCLAQKSPPGINELWGAIVCNEGMNLVQAVARGMGRDIYWPPSHPRGIEEGAAYEQTVLEAQGLSDCSRYSAQGLYGVTSDPKFVDPLGRWAYAQYQGRDVATAGATKIIFSNGRYDPWSAAGVNQDLTESLVSVVLDNGAHHSDLMFESPEDPASIKDARRREKDIIMSWLAEHDTAHKPASESGGGDDDDEEEEDEPDEPDEPDAPSGPPAVATPSALASAVVGAVLLGAGFVAGRFFGGRRVMSAQRRYRSLPPGSSISEDGAIHGASQYHALGEPEL